MTRPVYTKTPESRMAGAERQIRFLERREQVPHGRGANVPYCVSGALTVANGDLRWYARAKGSIAKVHAAIGTAPAGSGVTVRVNKNGTSLGTCTIAAGGHTATFIPGRPGLRRRSTTSPSTSPLWLDDGQAPNLVVQLRMAGSLMAGTTLDHGPPGRRHRQLVAERRRRVQGDPALAHARPQARTAGSSITGSRAARAGWTTASNSSSSATGRR